MIQKTLTIQDFNEKFSGYLHIELTKPTQPISPNLYNEYAPADAKIKSISFEAEVDNEANPPDGDEYFRAPTKEELETVYHLGSSLKMNSRGGTVEHFPPNGKTFSAKDLIAAIEETERQTRKYSEWFGGIDCHHIYFEGMRAKDGVWQIFWGS
jgi:hypothetical protein